MREEQRKRVALVVLTRAGLELALCIGHELEEAECHVYASARALTVDLSDPLVTRFEQLGPTLADLWKTYDQLVLCFALGAVVRLIAPFLQDKRVDPGVVAIDDAGRFAISVVAGHLGGANDLATRCAHVLGALPVVTTASDVRNTLAVDMLVCAQRWRVEEEASDLTRIAAAIVNGERVAVFQDAGVEDWWETERAQTANLVRVSNLREVTPATYGALLIISDMFPIAMEYKIPVAICHPPTLVLGIGCRRGVSFATLDAWIKETLAINRIALLSVTTLASADIKADEEGLQQLAQHYGWSFEVHSVEALKAVTVPSPSERVRRLVGTPSVSEAAALLSSRGGELIVPKCKFQDLQADRERIGMTLAVARYRH